MTQDDPFYDDSRETRKDHDDEDLRTDREFAYDELKVVLKMIKSDSNANNIFVTSKIEEIIERLKE